jgi:hypothetical protein
MLLIAGKRFQPASQPPRGLVHTIMFEAQRFLGRQGDMVWPSALEIVACDFALAAVHGLPALRLVAAGRPDLSGVCDSKEVGPTHGARRGGHGSDRAQAER